jgi:hypothetical protein
MADSMDFAVFHPYNPLFVYLIPILSSVHISSCRDYFFAMNQKSYSHILSP